MARVTVLMAVYNGMPYLPEAVESICAQTLTDWTFLIINDGSTDGSKEYLDGLNDKRFHIIHQSNQGLAASLNNGLEVCETEFVARLDSDDVCLPTRLAEQLEFMAANPDVGMLGTQIERLGSCKSGFQSSLPCDHDTIVDALLEGKHAMCHPTIMCKTEVMRKAGGYWQHPIAQDWDIYLKVSELARIANLDRCLVKYRIHSASLNGKKLAGIRRNQRYAAECARRRTNNEPHIDLKEFQELEQKRGWIWRLNEKRNVFAMNQYRQAMTNILGGNPLLGYSRLAFAAGCSPGLTTQRLSRMFRYRLFQSNNNGSSRSSATPVAAGTASEKAEES